MSGVNKVILIGRVGKDVEVKKFENGSAVANFSIATSETYKDKNGDKQEKTEWHQISAWRGIGEVCAKYVKKGDLVSVIGKLTSRSYEKADGSKGYVSEVVIDELSMLSSNRKPATSPAEPAEASATDDLPY